jgi:hypothetical protein
VRCPLGYHVQSGNKDGFLSLDFGLRAFGVQNAIQRPYYYRKFVYEKVSISPGKGAVIDSSVFWPGNHLEFYTFPLLKHPEDVKEIVGTRVSFRTKHPV